MYKIDNKNLRAKIKNLFLKTMVCFSGCLMSSASLQKLFCGVCSALKCSFEEFVRENVVFQSYSSAIFSRVPSLIFFSDSQAQPLAFCSLSTQLSLRQPMSFVWSITDISWIPGLPGTLPHRLPLALLPGISPLSQRKSFHSNLTFSEKNCKYSLFVLIFSSA